MSGLGVRARGAIANAPRPPRSAAAMIQNSVLKRDQAKG